MCPKFYSRYCVLTRLAASRSEQCSHSRTFTVLPFGQMANVYKCILYTFTVVSFTSCSGFSLPSGLCEAGRLRHFCDAFPLSILRILNSSMPSIHLLGSILLLLRPRGIRQEFGLRSRNPLLSGHATLTVVYGDVDGTVLLLGPCH